MNPTISASSQPQPTYKSTGYRSCCVFFFFLALPVSIAFISYNLDASSPKPRVIDGSIFPSLEKVASGRVYGPEDLVYDPVSKVLYTGCEDGSIKRVMLGDGSGLDDGLVEVEELANTGGRPLGLALSRSADGNDLIIADAFKGLLKLTKEGELITLTKEAEGLAFNLTDGVDVAKDGTIYFTDGSSKDGYGPGLFDVEQVSGRPYGRLLSFDQASGETRVLLRDLYFPNGVTLAHDQASVIFCETVLGMCKRYHIRGALAGSVEPFINNTFGLPDNVHYDGEGRYWIGLPLPASLPGFLHKVMNYHVVQKAMIIAEKYIGFLGFVKSAGVLAVDLEGNPVAYFYDWRLTLISSGIKIGQHLYLGSVYYDHILRLNLTQYEF